MMANTNNVKYTTCCLCGRTIAEELSNNAEPAMEGRCCDVCNFAFVIPQRMKDMKDSRRTKVEPEYSDDMIVSDLSGSV